jgi:prepilin-type N-terminal cleavage/methylation domain-containing protein
MCAVHYVCKDANGPPARDRSTRDDYVLVRCDAGHALWPLIGHPKPLVGAPTHPFSGDAASHPMNTRSRGFTLAELMVVLGIAAAILALGTPSFREFHRNNRLTVAANDVLGMVLSSRAEALRRQTTVSMCTTADPSKEDGTCGTGAGWLVFVDANDNCVRDAGEEFVTSLRVDTDVNAAVNGKCVSFASTGFRRIVAGQPATQHMMYCDARGNAPRTPGSNDSAARGVEVMPTGRGAVVKYVDQMNGWASGGDGVKCP